MADHIEELRKRGMITSLAKVPVSKTDHIEALRGLVEKMRGLAAIAGPFGISSNSVSGFADELDAALAAMGGQGEVRPCTCPPDDSPPSPCPRRYALSECRKAAQQPEALSPGGTVKATRDDELPGMWSVSDFTGGRDYEQPEARVGGEVDATDRVKFNWNEHLREHNALEYQHDFRLFEVVCSYVTKHLDEAHTTPPAKVPEGARLWLWRHHDHFLAFTHQYPCFTPGGDPMTLGPPVGYAVFRVSHDRAAAQPGGSNNDQVSTGNKTTHERNIMNEEQRKSFENAARPLIQWLCENAHPHHTVIVTPTNAELLEGSCSTGQILDFVKG